jgi:hypothetical protein
MANMSDYLENLLVDGMFRGGCLTSAGAAGSSAVVKGIWTATTAYSVGDIVVPHANMTAPAASCCAARPRAPRARPTRWPCRTRARRWRTARRRGPRSPRSRAELKLYAALLTINKGLRANSTAYSSGDCISLTPTGGVGGDTRQHIYRCTTSARPLARNPRRTWGARREAITDGTAVFTEIGPVMDSNTGFPAGLAEVTGGSYARVSMAAGHDGAVGLRGHAVSGTTTASSGTGGTTSNNNAITFATPTANWTSGSSAVGMMAVYDALTGGNLVTWAALNVPKSVNNGDSAPSFTAASLSVQADN